MQRQLGTSVTKVNILKASSPSASTSVGARRLALTARHLSGGGQAAGMKHVQSLTVFGGGLMGAGIAQVAAHHGFKVTLCDLSDQALSNGRTIIQKSLKRVAAKAHPSSESDQGAFVSSVLDNINWTTDPVEAAKRADLIVEAIVENIKVKQDLFAMLDGEAPRDCIFASNTSSLSIAEIASSTSADRRQRFGGLHFFNPVPQMKLVEVIRTPETSSDTYDALVDVCRRLEKKAVTCKDTPGFIVNRLLVPYMFEAVRMLERGDATAEDIDAAMKLGAGYPMGPFELLDFVGLDTAQHIMEGWRGKLESGEDDTLSPDMVRPSAILQQKVAEGKMGRKTGEGFYKY